MKVEPAPRTPGGHVSLEQRVREIGALLKANDWRRAPALCADLVATYPDAAEAWLLMGRVRQMEGDFRAMLDAVETAHRLTPNADIALLAAEALLLNGKALEARARLQAVEVDGQAGFAAWRRLTVLYMQFGAFADADRCARNALAIRPDDIDTLYNLAPTSIALGRLDEADSVLSRVIAARPADWEAYYSRATLRKQTPARNHVAELHALMARVPEGQDLPPPLGYALAKELEDLGAYDEAFDVLARAARARRKRLSYRVEDDVSAMAKIAAVFDAGYFARPSGGYEDDAPIFIVGLPRSGTTLIDRMMSRHALVESRGELNDLPLAITRLTPSAEGKRQRIEAAADIDPRALGEAYSKSVRGWGEGPPHLIDKTPLNFLYVGLIAKALPRARIVHVRRDPMASGFAMFKTLFRMGYPFSYDLSDIARYYAAYATLMAHWRGQLGARLIEISYEDVVNDIEGQARALLDACGLDWEPTCVAFHENEAPTATASAAQVRRPLYRDSLDQWRRYERHLAPLSEGLASCGVQC